MSWSWMVASIMSFPSMVPESLSWPPLKAKRMVWSSVIVSCVVFVIVASHSLR